MNITKLDTQVALFFENINIDKQIELANVLKDSELHLLDPIVRRIPSEIPKEIRENAVNISYTNTDYNIEISEIVFNVIIKNDKLDILKLINTFFNILKSIDINIRNIGIVKGMLIQKFDFEKFKNVFLNNSEFLDSEVANLHWYKKENSYNVWKFLNYNNNPNEYILSVDVNNKTIKDENEFKIQLSNILGIINKNLEEFLKKIGE